MSEPAALPSQLAHTRATLAQIVTHVMARRRFMVVGRFGLRAAPGSIATPMFDDEVLRMSATSLLRERRTADGTVTSAHALHGATLGQLASFAEVDITAAFSVGADTAAPGDPATPLHVDVRSATVLLRWFGWAAESLDALLADRPAADASAVELWPEHFDLAVDVLAGPGRVNLGASPGDSSCDVPYVYVGPWGARRPGDPSFWDAPFGATARYEDVARAVDPVEAMRAFWARGLGLLEGPD